MTKQTNRTRGSLTDIDVAILAGGLGTRIQPVLRDVPKFLAPIEGRTYADYLFEWLALYGVRRIVLCLGHLAHRVAETIKHAPAAAEIVFSVEPAPLGTAGALRHARAHLQSDPVLVLNGDSFVRADLGTFLAKHRAGGAPATLLCTEVHNAGRFGKVELGSDGAISGFVEKHPAETGPGLVNAGAYLMNASFLNEIAAGSAHSLEREIFATQPAGRLGAYCGAFPFIDIGTPDDLTRATAAQLTVGKHEGTR